ncbi:MAG: twin arginine-targeting protein translocase TatC [Desulfobacterales bacterium C00003104]|jgi:sec-independent protein translocase protein TatC|nr:MAG: twin arginine-targeting protein translocase TatC [Desulfobacterales bacterium C00003104]
MDSEKKLPFTGHLEELRKRLITCCIAVGVCFASCYAFSKKLFEILMMPLLSVLPAGDKLIYTGLPDAFFTYLKVALLAGILLAMPVIFYQLWMFIIPGLYDKERHIVIYAVFFSSIFFVGGALFGYFIVFPFGFKFFLSFSSDFIHPMLSIKEYLAFATKLLLAFGVVFEMPIFILILTKLGLVTVKNLRTYRKYVIVLFFAFSAILTPPDVVTQVMMAGPLMILYELSIIGAMIITKKKQKEQKETEGQKE